MKRLFTCLALCGLLAACSGVPLMSVPRLVKLPQQLLTADPAELMLAVQVDARMTPPPDAQPTLDIAIKPRDPKAFEAVDRKLPMRMVVAAMPLPELGLQAAPADRRWLLYSLTPESSAEMARIQAMFQRVQAERQGQSGGGGGGGGSLALGIAQEGLAVDDPALANTRWESWFRSSGKDGFFELWSGTLADLQKQAKDKAAKTPPAARR